MTLQEAIEARHSVRAYKELPLAEDVIKVLEEQIAILAYLVYTKRPLFCIILEQKKFKSSIVTNKMTTFALWLEKG